MRPGAQPAPTLAWAGPLVAGEIALAARLDGRTKDALVCIAAGGHGCDLRLPALRLVHLAEILVFLACLWWIGRVILRDELQACLVAAVGLAFREVVEFANLVMTEPLYLMVYSLFAAVAGGGLCQPQGRGLVAAGGAPAGRSRAGEDVGNGADTRACRLCSSARPPSAGAPCGRALVAALCVVAAAGAVVALWMARSAVLFHSLAHDRSGLPRGLPLPPRSPTIA